MTAIVYLNIKSMILFAKEDRFKMKFSYPMLVNLFGFL